jgi:hypothetical protein
MTATLIHLAFFQPLEDKRPASKLFALPFQYPTDRAAEACFHADNAPEGPFLAMLKRKKGFAYSLSVGDIVRVREDSGAVKYFLCESMGWKEITQWSFRRRFHKATGALAKIRAGLDKREESRRW